MIAVQTIKTTWTKSSRGGSLATLRSRIPKQLPLRLIDGFPPLLWHSVVYSEHNRFTEPFAINVTTDCDNHRFGCVNAEIELHDDSATLTYRYQTGAPARQFFDKTGTCVAPEHLIEIPNNRWGTIEYNGRFSCIDSGNWWYEHVVVNVAVAQSFSPNAFMATKPIERYTQLARLR